MSDPAEDDDTALKLSLPPQSDSTADAEEQSTEASVGSDTDYSAMTAAELRSLAKSRGLTGYSTMNKAELIALLSDS